MRKYYAYLFILYAFLGGIMYMSIFYAGEGIENWDDGDITGQLDKLTIKPTSYCTFMLALKPGETVQTIEKKLKSHFEKGTWGSCPGLQGLVCSDQDCAFCGSVSNNFTKQVFTLFCNEGNQTNSLQGIPGVLMAVQVTLHASESQKNLEKLASLLPKNPKKQDELSSAL